jgi:hypothetical protein
MAKGFVNDDMDDFLCGNWDLADLVSMH